MYFVNRFIIVFLLFLNMGCTSSVGDIKTNKNPVSKKMHLYPKKIKDPIFDEMYCYSNDISWDGNKLVTDLEVAYLSCNQSGYIAYVFGEDFLKEDEVLRIKEFLIKFKEMYRIDEFDYVGMSIIDILWITKNIYELRDLEPAHHAKLFEAMKKTVKYLLKELDIEKNLLEQCDLNDEDKGYLCNIFTVKNRKYELDKR